jgi:spermidine synthase
MLALQLFITGFLSLALENLGLQVLFIYHPEASETVALGLSIFLLGLAFSNQIIHKFNKVILKNGNLCIYLLLLTIAILSTPILNNVERNYTLIHSLFPNGEVYYWLSFSFLAFLYLLIPALSVGIFFPIIVDRDLQHTEQIKRSVGWMNSLDFYGAIFSSLIFGFIFIPYFGLSKSFWLISLISTLCSIYYALKLNKITFIPVVILLINLVYNYPTALEIPKRENETQVLYQSNSSFGLIRVVKEKDKDKNKKVLMINNRDMCGYPGSPSERALANIILKDRSATENKVLNIGLGCGFTASEIVSMGPDIKLDIVEINQKVFEATSIHFRNENNQVLLSPQTKVIIEDGIKYLGQKRKLYDRIVIDIEEPTIVHSSIFYTQEGFKLVKNNLKPNGLFSLWSLKQNETAKIILNTLRSVFKYATVVYSSGQLIFIASDQAIDHLTEKTKFLENVEKIPLDDIATVSNNPYPRYYNIYQIFGIDEKLKDPFVIGP